MNHSFDMTLSRVIRERDIYMYIYKFVYIYIYIHIQGCRPLVCAPMQESESNNRNATTPWETTVCFLDVNVMSLFLAQIEGKK